MRCLSTPKISLIPLSRKRGPLLPTQSVESSLMASIRPRPLPPYMDRGLDHPHGPFSFVLGGFSGELPSWIRQRDDDELDHFSLKKRNHSTNSARSGSGQAFLFIMEGTPCSPSDRTLERVRCITLGESGRRIYILQ
jgi:hypothetical protein